MKGTFFLLRKSRLGSYRPHDPIEGYKFLKVVYPNTMFGQWLIMDESRVLVIGGLN